MTTTEHSPATSTRFVSLDFMRGFIMVFLALESTGLYEHLSEVSDEGSVFHGFMQQFFHHPWHGLHAWDIVQPAFMFIAGTAMAFSLSQQRKRGETWSYSFKKVLKRSFWLFFWGVLDYAVSIHDNTVSFKLWDVLTQLSFTTLVTFFVFRWRYTWQVVFCIGLLLLTELLYRFTHVPGFDQPFTDQHNFGNYVDLLLMNRINDGGWVAINCIPTAVHTIAGAMVGKWLLKYRTVKNIVIWGIACLIIGYGLDYANVTPIIKRIATSSFTIASLGWCLLMLALVFWWIDMKDHKNYLGFFTIVGMNSLFIYLFFEIVASNWFNAYINTLSMGLLHYTSLPEMLQLILTSLFIFSIEWYLCYFLYKRKIFFKL